MIWILIAILWALSGYFVDKYYISIAESWLEYNYFAPSKFLRIICYVFPFAAFISAGVVYGWIPKQRRNKPLSAEERYNNFNKRFLALSKNYPTLESFLKEYPQ